MATRAHKLVVLAAAMLTREASATERPFTYTYGSDVLLPGEMEIEPWTTVRTGRESFYLRFDHRLEFELGITRIFQLAFYANWGAFLERPSEDADITGKVQFRGGSVESKLKLLDPVADPIGFGLYFEPGLGPHSAELETKLLFDKRIGDLYGAFNVVGEYEPEWDQPDGTIRDYFLVEGDFGLTYFFLPNFSAGFEARGVLRLRGDTGWEHGAIFVGPVVSVTTDPWWATLTVLPQIYGLRDGLETHLVLDKQERVQIRLLMGFHL
jgi:hypothetical protein